MIRLVGARSRTRDADIVPMINVAFLLLVFLLMTAVLAPPEPVEIDLPVAEIPPEDRRADTLYIAADGRFFFGDATGEAALVALPAGPLRLKADRALPGTELSRLLSRLAASGVTEAALVTGVP